MGFTRTSKCKQSGPGGPVQPARPRSAGAGLAGRGGGGGGCDGLDSCPVPARPRPRPQSYCTDSRLRPWSLGWPIPNVPPREGRPPTLRPCAGPLRKLGPGTGAKSIVQTSDRGQELAERWIDGAAGAWLEGSH
uniref:Forkhead box protein F2-like n=1 Tax=Phascolarctos cinereus TaxID=38626 RepID=A0A6P5K390_PHACI|nr:forkhead box protein F2-like [Phascolarctos cinereus]